MKKSLLPGLSIPALLFTYDFLFWGQQMGVNLILFFVLLLTLFFFLFPHLKKNKTALILLLLSLISSALVIVNNTSISEWTSLLLITTAVGFVQQGSFRSVPFALGYYFGGIIQIPRTLWKSLQKISGRSPWLEWMISRHRLIYFPLVIALIFLIIYSIGDAQFAEALYQAVTNFFNFLGWFSEYLSLPHLMFLLSGLLIITAAIIPQTSSKIVERELRQSDSLHRDKKKRERPNTGFKSAYPGSFQKRSLFTRRNMLVLRNEYHRGVITLVLINALLLFVNLVDISKVWFEGMQIELSSESTKANALLRSQAVHEGTDTLILSILLAMAVLMFFFRGNINFLRKNRLLIQLSYAWLLQNAMLAMTVAMRNFYYINDCGLTMKRIGVFAFLIATVLGLATFYFKIHFKKSGFYLVRINSWVVCGLLLIVSTVDWDPLIAAFNINHLPIDKLDRKYLFWLNDHALPELIQDKELAQSTPEQDILKDRIRRFVENYKQQSWQSFNYADYKVYRFLVAQGIIE